jgi:hypothetical protein
VVPFGGYVGGAFPSGESIAVLPFDILRMEGAGAGYGGIVVSYAAALGSLGLSTSLWSANVYWWGSHVALHVPVAGPPGGGAATLHLVVGAGCSALAAVVFRPDLSLGLLWPPPRARDGWFGGLRLEGGLTLAASSDENSGLLGPAADLNGSIGYRWKLDGSPDSVHVQLAPFIELSVWDEHVWLGGGAQFLLGLNFGL